MFLTANLVLLLMAAGVAWLAVDGLRARLPWRQLLSPHAPEHLLFTGQGETLRLRCAAPAMLLALCCIELEVALLHSQLAVNAPAFCAVAERVLDVILCCAVVFKLFACTRYNLWQLGFAFGCYFILRWVYFNSHHIFFILAVFLILAAKDVPIEAMMKPFLIVGAATVGFVVICSLGGWLGFQRIWYIHLHYEGQAPWDMPMQTFGYTHYNTLGGLLLGLAFAWVLLRHKHFSWPDCLPLAALAAVLQFVVDSSASALVVLTLLACCVLYRLCPRLLGSKAVCYLGTAVPVLLAAGNYLLAFMMRHAIYDGAPAPSWLPLLDRLMTSRLLFSCMALVDGSIRIAGQMLDLWYAIDNYYIYSMLTLGPVVFALILAGACATVYRLFRAQRPLAALAVLCGCLYASFEIQFIHASANPTLLLYALALYGGAAAIPEAPPHRQKEEGP